MRDDYEDEEKRHFRELAALALQMMRISLRTLPQSPSSQQKMWQAKGLFKANDNSSTAVHAALLSAVIELKQPAVTDNAAHNSTRFEEAAAEALIRTAYNRSRRKQRQDKRLQAEAGRGEQMLDSGNGQRCLDRVANCFWENPEIRAQIQDLVGYVYRGLDSRECSIIQLSADGLTQEEVAQKLECHRSTVSRVLSRVHDTVRRINQPK